MKDADAVHALQCGEDAGAISVGVNRSGGAFQLTHGIIAVYTNEQCVALVTSRFKVAYVPKVKEVKAAVGNDEPLAALAEVFSPFRQLVPRDNLVAKIHIEILANAVLSWQRF